MPVPFMAGLAVVAKASGAVGVAFAAGDAALQVGSVSCFPADRVGTRRGLRRSRAAREQQKEGRTCGALQRGVGALDGRRTLRAFAAGTAVGTVGATGYTVYHGVSTTAVPLTREHLLGALSLGGGGLLLWAPMWCGGMLVEEEPEWRLPEWFLSLLLSGSVAFAVPSVLHAALGVPHMAHLRDAATGVAAPLSGIFLLLFVNQYAWMQAHKRPPDGRTRGPLVEYSSRWLIAAGAASGNVLGVALLATPWYHHGHFLVWGITNPALMYTMAIMAEDEIESWQMEEHLHATDKHGQLLVDPDAYMQRRLVRAMLPLLGLPFAYVADRDDVRHLVKVFLAGVGAVGLGVIVATFQDEWHALFKYDYPEIAAPDPLAADAGEPLSRHPSAAPASSFRKPGLHDAAPTAAAEGGGDGAPE